MKRTAPMLAVVLAGLLVSGRVAMTADLGCDPSVDPIAIKVCGKDGACCPTGGKPPFACIAVVNDPKNCGGCGVACTDGQACMSGKCVAQSCTNNAGCSGTSVCGPSGTCEVIACPSNACPKGTGCCQGSPSCVAFGVDPCHCTGCSLTPGCCLDKSGQYSFADQNQCKSFGGTYFVCQQQKP